MTQPEGESSELPGMFQLARDPSDSQVIEPLDQKRPHIDNVKELMDDLVIFCKSIASIMHDKTIDLKDEKPIVVAGIDDATTGAEPVVFWVLSDTKIGSEDPLNLPDSAVDSLVTQADVTAIETKVNKRFWNKLIYEESERRTLVDEQVQALRDKRRESLRTVITAMDPGENSDKKPGLALVTLYTDEDGETKVTNVKTELFFADDIFSFSSGDPSSDELEQRYRDLFYGKVVQRFGKYLPQAPDQILVYGKPASDIKPNEIYRPTDEDLPDNVADFIDKSRGEADGKGWPGYPYAMGATAVEETTAVSTIAEQERQAGWLEAVKAISSVSQRRVIGTINNYGYDFERRYDELIASKWTIQGDYQGRTIILVCETVPHKGYYIKAVFDDPSSGEPHLVDYNLFLATEDENGHLNGEGDTIPLTMAAALLNMVADMDFKTIQLITR